MGWKIYLIAITNAADTNILEVPERLGLGSLQPIEEVGIHGAQYKKEIAIGKHNDLLFIVNPELVLKMYDNQPSEFEKTLSAAFPNSEIAAITIYQTSSMYGYNIINNGQRRRVKSGADWEVYIDYGEQLPEEIEIAGEQLFEEEELEEIREDHSELEVQQMIKHEISTRTAFRLTKRYFGQEFDISGSAYESITVTKFA